VGDLGLQCFLLGNCVFISIVAETNRAPFDLPEAEAEIVWLNIEYSSIIFCVFFFLGEYGNILLMSHYLVICFLGADYYFCACSDLGQC